MQLCAASLPTSTRPLAAGVTFVNLDRPYPNQVFTILIWGSDLGKFSPPPANWHGKRVCATGVIALDRSVPEIVAREAAQVRIAK